MTVNKGEKKSKRKGFTIIELMIVVLMISVISAIAVPTYFRATEKTRSSEAINLLGVIAKAEQRNKLQTHEYTDKISELDIDLKPYTEATATDSKFDTQYFDVGLKDDYAKADRKAGGDNYSLMIDYETSKLYCESQNSSICQRLGIEEDNPFINWPQIVECTPSDYGQQNSTWHCVRTVYKNGTTKTALCANNLWYCYYYDDDNNQYGALHNNVTVTENGAQRRVFTYEETDNGLKTTYSFYLDDGSPRGYSVYDTTTMTLIENLYKDPSTGLFSWRQGSIEYQPKTDGTVRALVYNAGGSSIIGTRDFDANGNILYVSNYASSGNQENIYFDSSGNITYYWCGSGSCKATNYQRPTANDYSVPTIPTLDNFCDTHPGGDGFLECP